MSDHYQSVTVVFEKDLCDEGAEMAMNTMRQIRGVADVQLGKPVGSDEYFARVKWGNDVGVDLFEVIRAIMLKPKVWERIRDILREEKRK